MRNYKKKANRKKCTAEMLETARSRLKDGESKRRIAADLGISEATLRARLQVGIVSPNLGRYISVFSTSQSEELAEYCREMDRRFYGLTFKDLRHLAYQYAVANQVVHCFNEARKMAGPDWAEKFMKDHRLSLRTPQQTSLARMMGFNRVQVNGFFDNLTAVKARHKFPPNREYNMDESGMSTVPDDPPKVVAPTGKASVSKASSAERGELTTAVCAMSATGHFITPALIFKRKRKNPLLLNGAPPGTLLMVSDSGYINTDLFLEWLHHFQKEVKASLDDPVLLILDNHSSHLSLEGLLFCRANGITLLSIPPHSSHKMQPLDRCFFKALKDHFSVACENWLGCHDGRVITQYQMSELFGIAYGKTATIENAANAFRTCGIEPLNRDVFTDDDFKPSNVTEIAFDPDKTNPPDEVAPASFGTPQAPSAPRVYGDPAVFKTPGSSSNTPADTEPEPVPLDLSKTAKVSPADIRPFPKRKKPQKRRKRGQKSEIITGSPFKARLEAALAEKAQRPKAKRKLAAELPDQGTGKTPKKPKTKPDRKRKN